MSSFNNSLLPSPIQLRNQITQLSWREMLRKRRETPLLSSIIEEYLSQYGVNIPELIQLSQEYLSDFSIAQEAIVNHDRGLLSLLLEHGDMDYNEALLEASQVVDVQLVKYLVERYGLPRGEVIRNISWEIANKLIPEEDAEEHFKLLRYLIHQGKISSEVAEKILQRAEEQIFSLEF